MIQIVAIDGMVVGRIRHNGGRWIATGATDNVVRSPIVTPSAPPSWPWHATQSRGDHVLEALMPKIDEDDVLLLWRALCAPRGRPPRSNCPLYEKCDRWSGPNDYLLSMEETVEQSERRRARWPCSRAPELLGSNTSQNS